MTLASDLASVGTATLGEAWKTALIMSSPPLPLMPEMSVAGGAITVRCKPGDNLAIHRAVATAWHNDAVLVIDYGGCTTSGPFGEIMALACQMRGIKGLIIDGAIRDSVQMTRMGFAVFARGKAIRGTEKSDQGTFNIPIELGNVSIGPDDMIVADADGIVVFPRSEAEEALRAAQSRIAAEEVVMARLKAGETTVDIFELDKRK